MSAASRWVWRIFWIVDLAAAAVLLFFFAWGLSDGTISSFNIALWLAILGGTAAVLWGGRALRDRGNPVGGAFILAILAGPALLFAFFTLMLVVLAPDWK